MLVFVSLYAFIVLVLMVGPQLYGFLSIFREIKDQYIALFLFSIYLAMLVIYVRSQIHRGSSRADTYRKAFVSSFWVGLMWGLMMSFADGIPRNADILHLILSLVGVIIVGFIFGALGRGISMLFINNLAK